MAKRLTRPPREAANIAAMYRNDFYNIFSNILRFENAPAGVPERWILKNLICRGQIFVLGDEWLEVCGNNGYFVYDEPTALLVRTPNRRSTFEVPTSEGVWIGANNLRKPIDVFLKMQSAKIAELEISLKQNIVASRSPDILGVENEDMRLSIEQALLQKNEAVPAIVVSKSLLDGITQVRLSTSFEADKINQLKQQIITETLEHYGIINSNSDKRERVQVGEMQASAAYAYDSIYTLIDTFNRDAERGGISTRLVFNGAVDDFMAAVGGNTQNDGENNPEETEI